MKTPSLPIPHGLRATLVIIVSAIVLPAISNARLYWDTNGSTPGSGNAAPSGVWNLSAQNWNNDQGDGTPLIWLNDGTGQAVFSAGSDATGAYTVNLSAGEIIRLAALSLRSGSLTLTADAAADVLDFGTMTAALVVEAGSVLDVQTQVLGTAGLIKSGTGVLRLADAGPSGAWNVSNGRLILGANQSVTTLTLGGSSTSVAALELEDGIVLDLGGNITLTSLSQQETVAVQGGVLRLNGSRTITIPNVPAPVDIEISSVLADGSEVSSLTKSNNAGTLLLSGANTYTGATVLAGSNSGTLLVQGNRASIAGSFSIVVNGSTLTLGTALDTDAVNRLRDDAAITLNGQTGAGASLNYNGSDFATQSIHQETIGAITVGGRHRSFITLTPGAGDEVVIQAASMSRAENGILLLRGSNLGAASGTADSSRLQLADTSSLVGGDNSTTGRAILPWAVGDTSVAGPGTGFLTYDEQTGLRLLDNATEFVAPASAGEGLNVRKSATGNLTLTSSVAHNTWTNAATGTVALGAGVTLGLESGAVLFTANGTFAGGTFALAETRQGIIHLAANAAVTATINSSLSGGNGLLISGTGTGNKIVVLGGDNSFTGGVLVYAGILQLNHPGALNSSGVNSLVLQAGGTLRLNGNSITLSGLDGAGTIVNNNAANAAELTINGGGTHTGALNNGSAAALGLVKTGNALLLLGGNNNYTGSTVIQQGSVHVQPAGNNPGGNGGLRGTSKITIGKSALLQINNGNVAGSNNADRVNDSAPLLLLGSLTYNHSASNLAYEETLGALILGQSAAQITASIAGASGTSVLTFTSLAGREHGGVLNFTGTSLGAADSNAGRNQIFFNSGVAYGFIGGWATIGNEFAKYTAVTGVTGFLADDYFTGVQEDWTPATHAKPDAAQILDSDRNVLSLNLTGGGPKNVNLGGNVLNIGSGGLIKQGGSAGTTGAANVATISQGSITAGGAAAAELFIRVTGANLNISAAITDNLGDGDTPGAVTVVKSGPGTAVLTGNNIHSGGFFLHEGVVVVNNNGRTGTGSVHVGPGARLGGNGIIGSLSPGAGIEIEPGGTLFVGQSTGLGAQTLTLRAENGFLISGSVELDIVGGAAGGLLNPQTGNNDRLIFTTATGVGFGTPDLSGALLKVNTNITLTPDAWTVGSAWKLFDWYGLTSGFDNLPDTGTRHGNPNHLPDLSSLGLAWDWSQLYTDGSLSIVVPEPGRALLLTLGMAFSLLRRTRPMR
ncbi:MAG TPA: hypothetical protein DIT13_15305 [Verrucomicrobiales bacterium]|nr:hypothetical protein [Verrucomicrobiales bacterium]HRJ08455.1 autotransporter-associated beta strand repeat-containing protein [Prosthecobacter sp.]HRK15148.1 autotransporter-associated beta strand repeat-containing protein [Prosthecobacter sp.]